MLLRHALGSEHLLTAFVHVNLRAFAVREDRDTHCSLGSETSSTNALSEDHVSRHLTIARPVVEMMANHHTEHENCQGVLVVSVPAGEIQRSP